MDTLKDIPDFSDWPHAKSWVNNRLAAIASCDFDDKVRASFTPHVLTPQDGGDVFGYFENPEWRRFVLGTFAADWASYTTKGDRVDWARLAFVLSLFPAGFRLWTCRFADGSIAPVGYTGWYPIAKNVFDLMRNEPESITHRGVMFPLRSVSEDGAYVYLFNYSLVPQLRGTEQSRLMLKTYADDIAKVKSLGRGAVTVSGPGAKVAERFGLKLRGEMVFEGEREGVYTT